MIFSVCPQVHLTRYNEKRMGWPIPEMPRHFIPFPALQTSTQIFATAFHKKYMEVRCDRLRAKLPHHQCYLTPMVG